MCSELGNHYPDIFYNINELSFKKKIELLKDAKETCFNWWTDVLDCSKSFARQRVEMSFEEAIRKCNEHTFFTFIHRRGFEGWKERNEIMDGWRLEVGYRTMTSPDYFLWINCEEDQVDKLAKKYKLHFL